MCVLVCVAARKGRDNSEVRPRLLWDGWYTACKRAYKPGALGGSLSPCSCYAKIRITSLDSNRVSWLLSQCRQKQPAAAPAYRHVGEGAGHAGGLHHLLSVLVSRLWRAAAARQRRACWIGGRPTCATQGLGQVRVADLCQPVSVVSPPRAHLGSRRVGLQVSNQRLGLGRRHARGDLDGHLHQLGSAQCIPKISRCSGAGLADGAADQGHVNLCAASATKLLLDHISSKCKTRGAMRGCRARIGRSARCRATMSSPSRTQL